jgi:ketosteroid isomerase-like protein
MAAPTSVDLEARVRALWAAYARGGAAALRELVGEDVEWVPLSTDGRPVPLEELFGEWGRRQAERTSAAVHGFETRGDCVLAYGSLRTFRDGGFVDVQPCWVYFFREARLVRAAGYATREDALRAIGAYQSTG